MTVGITRVATSVAEVAVEARLRGATVGTVGIHTQQVALLIAIGRALRFPAHYGHHLDALDECIRDLTWLPTGEVVLVWDGEDALRRADPRGHREVLEVLAAAAEDSAPGPRPLRVVLTGVTVP